MNEKGILTKMAKSLHLACRASGAAREVFLDRIKQD